MPLITKGKIGNGDIGEEEEGYVTAAQKVVDLFNKMDGRRESRPVNGLQFSHIQKY